MVMLATKASTNALMPDKAVSWHIAMRPGKRRALNKDDPADALIRQGREAQSWHSGQSRASVSGDQAPVRLCERFATAG
jgi:hypothetical protein